MSEPNIVPAGHVELISPRGGRLTVEKGSVTEQDLRDGGWKDAPPATPHEGRGEDTGADDSAFRR